MSLLTAGVMSNLFGASSSMKLADVSMSVYTQAQNRGDETTMKRALGYATDSMSNANESSQQARDALEEAQMEAKDQAKAEQQADLDKKAEEAAQVRKAQQQADLNENAQGTTQTKQQVPDNAVSSDIVEISNEGRSAAQASGQAAVVQDSTAQTGTDIPSQSGNRPVTEAKIYTPKGNTRPAHTHAKISVSV